jgi:hypothetical protein
MHPSHLGDDDTTSPEEYGLVDTDEAHILKPQHGIRRG